MKIQYRKWCLALACLTLSIGDVLAREPAVSTGVHTVVRERGYDSQARPKAWEDEPRFTAADWKDEPRLSASEVLTCWDINSPIPMEREIARAHALFEQGRFAELEKLAADQNAVMSDGQQRGPALLAGLDIDNVSCQRRTQSMEDARLKLFPPHREKLVAWFMKYPNSVLANIALAMTPYEEALVVRGHGYSNEVLSEAWEPFRNLIAESERQLNAIPAHIKRHPLWYQSMLKVALMAAWDEPMYARLLDEAIARYPDYFSLYFQDADYYSSRWRESDADKKAFIDLYSMKAGHGAADVLYARMHWLSQSKQMFSSGYADWPRMKAGFESMIAKHPDPWNLNNYAKFACLAMDRDVLVAVMPRIATGIIEVWKSQRYFASCKAFSEKDPWVQNN